jgi:outer membrane lipoprotein-sorting protein
MRRAPLLVGLALAASLTSREAVAESAASLVARLDQASRSVETLEGEFTQRSRLKLFRQELVSRGRFRFRRPSQIRWEYLAPDPSVMVIDGERAILKTADAPPERFDLAHDPTVRAVTDQLFLWLGAGSLSRAGSDFILSTDGDPSQPALVLEPKPGTSLAKPFARIELRFDERLLLRAIRLRERSGDEKEIAFTRMQRNPKLPADAFAP